MTTFLLKDIVKNITDGTHSTVRDKVGGGYFLLSCKNIKDGNIVIGNNEREVDRGIFDMLRKRSKLARNDILITTVGTIGELALVYEDYPKYDFQRSVGIIKPDQEKVLPRYLYYALKSELPQINTLVKGAVQKCLFLGDIKEIKINLPEYNEQVRIANMLSGLDNRILNNTRTNDNLEKLLRLKFDHWIAGLSSAKSSNLAEIADYKNGLAMQKFRPKTGDGLPVIKIKEMNSGFSNDTERCDESIGEEYIVYDGDVLFAWSGSLCAKIWCGGVGGLNQHIFKVTSDKYPKWFYYLWTLHHLDKFIQIAAGKATTMGHIKRKELSLSEVLIPETQELESMDRIMSPLLEKYISNNIENRRLSALRDTLLPELMNGKIDLSKVEI